MLKKLVEHNVNCNKQHEKYLKIWWDGKVMCVRRFDHHHATMGNYGWHDGIEMAVLQVDMLNKYV